MVIVSSFFKFYRFNKFLTTIIYCFAQEWRIQKILQQICREIP